MTAVVYRYGATPRHARVCEFRQELARVPEGLDDIVHDGGGRIVFFNGPLTRNREFWDLQGERPRGWKKGDVYDKLPGAYYDGGIFLGVNGDYYAHGCISIALHEYGHAVDFLVGDAIFGAPLSKTRDVKKILSKERKNVDRYCRYPEEFVANAFDVYYAPSSHAERRGIPLMLGFLRELHRAVC